MADYQKYFINNMKFYRKKKGISQASLAEACDVSNGTIGNIECGMTKPSFDLIIKIADNLGVKPESLFFNYDGEIIPKVESDKFSKTQLNQIKTAFLQALDSAMEELEKQ